MTDPKEKKDDVEEIVEASGLDMYPDEPQSWEYNSGDKLWDEFMGRLQ
jgi:hypothetical protein